MGVAPQRALSLVLLPGGVLGQQVLEVARSWAAEGLLKRGLWVPSDQVQLSQHGGAAVRGILLDQVQESELDVAQVLAGVRLNLLTMVILQICTREQPVDVMQSQAADLLAEAVANARPESLKPDHGVDPIKFSVINLLTGPTGMSGVSYDQAAAKSYADTVVASPEDRRAADQMDRFVRPDDNLVQWATAQACTLAGLWSGMMQTPWEDGPTGVDGGSSFAQGDFAIPMRSFARVVTSAPTARRALARAMQDTRFAQGNALTSEHLLQVSDPESVLRQTLDAFDQVDGGRLGYLTPEAAPAPSKRKTPLMQALREFTRFSGREIILVPRFVIQRASSRWSNRATRALSGEEGIEEITVRGEGSDLSVYEEQFERQALEAERELNALPPSIPPAAPELWRTVVETTFALLDGSTMPSGIPIPMVADDRVVLPSALLAAPLPGPWDANAGESPEDLRDLGAQDLQAPACGTRQADEVQRYLASQVDTQTGLLSQAEARLQVARAELTVLEAQEKSDSPGESPSLDAEPASMLCEQCDALLDPDDTECPECGAEIDVVHEDSPIDDDDDAETDEEPQDQVSTAEQLLEARMAIAGAEADAEVAGRRAGLAERLSDRFAEWLTVRESSFLWRLSKRVEDRTRRAEEDRQRFYDEAVAVPAIDADEPRRARNQFANRFLLWLSIGLLLVLLTRRFGQGLADFLNLPGWLPWALLVVVLVAWLLIVLTSYYRRRSRFLKMVADLQHQQKDAVRRCRESAAARDRLNGLYEQLVDWGEILGYGVHDPWKPEEQWFSGTVSAELRATLPSCVDLAVPDPDDAAGTRLLQRTATRSITGEHWRSNTFSVLHDMLLIDGGYDPNDSNAAALLYEDAPVAPNGARAAMLERLRSGQLQSQCARKVLEAKIAGLYAERDTLMNHEVLPINSEYAAEQTSLLDDQEGLEKLRPRWGDYLTSALLGTTRFGVALWSARGRTDNQARSTMMTKRYAPPGLSMDKELPDAQLLAALPADRNRGVEVVVRCDFGTPVEKDALLLFTDEMLVEGVEQQPVPRAEPTQKSGPTLTDTAWVDDVSLFN